MAVGAALLAATLIAVTIHEAQPKPRAGERDVKRIHALAERFKGRLADGLSVWEDTSSCLISKSRKFDQTVTYSCRAEFQRMVELKNQQDITQIVSEQRKRLIGVEGVSNVGEVTYADSYGDELEKSNANVTLQLSDIHDGHAKCYLEYEWQSGVEADGRMVQIIRCSLYTDGVYFDKVETL